MKAVNVLVALSAMTVTLFFDWNSVWFGAAVASGVPFGTSGNGINLKIATSDTHFVAIDLAHVQLGNPIGNEGFQTSSQRSRGVEPSPFVIWRNQTTDAYGILIMTLDSHTAAQMGNRLKVGLPQSWQPVSVLWAQHFGLASGKGIEPSPWIVCRDYRLYTFSVTYSLDGTPMAGTSATFTPAVDSVTYGHATCATELPGSEFGDGKDRLFIGTDQGYVVVMLTSIGGGIIASDFLPVSAAPITCLEPLPQCGYIALGVLSGSNLKGVRYYPDSPTNFALAFTLTLSQTPAIQNFDSFGPDDVLLANCQGSLGIILANVSSALYRTRIAASQSGTTSPNLTPEQHLRSAKAVVTGSLLMLAEDGSAVTFDPQYSDQFGSSGCDLDITDSVADQCIFRCGDADGSGSVDISDAVYLIAYIFQGGPTPNPVLAGDADCSQSVDISDAVYLISYIFGGGPAPCAACK